MRRDQVLDGLLILLEQLVAHADKLEGRVQDLKLALGFDKVSNVQAAFGVSETLAKMLIVLAEGTVKTKDQLHAGLYFQEPENSQPDRKILDTLACKLRKHLRPFGVDLETVWSGGLRISEGLEVVRAAIEHAMVDPALAARQHKLERERQRQRLIRAAQKRKDRKTYEERSISRQRPWEAEGVCRATWYERRRQTGGLPTNDNALVQAENHAPQVAA